VVFMDQGRVLLDGSPDSVLSRLASNGHEEYGFKGGMNHE